MRFFPKTLIVLWTLPLLVWAMRGSTGEKVFDPARVASVQLVMTEEAFERMMAYAEVHSFEVEHAYVPADFIWDGESLSRVAVRIKGNSSRVRNPRQPSLKVDFDRLVEDQEFDGLRKLNFHNVSTDDSRLADFLSYGAWRDFEMPAPRTGWADVWINGSFFGFYTTVEQVDRRFLSRHFTETGGSLYKPEAPSGNLEWRGPLFEDYPNLEVKRQGGPDHEPLLRLIEVVNHQPVSDFHEVLDLKAVLTYFAGNTALGNWDDYAGPGYNYYLYEHAPGRFTMIPWDMNLSLWASLNVFRAVRPGRPLSSRLLGDPHHAQLYLQLLKAFLEGPGSPQALNARIEEAVPLLGHRLDANTIGWLREAIEARASSLRTQLQQHLEPPPVPRVFINEIMASNSKTLADEDGEFHDWLELHNPHPEAVDLSGMFLTDTPRNSRKWRFPENTFIAANGFLLLWASGNPEQGPLHLNFRFSREGEYAGLYDTEERLNLRIDAIAFRTEPFFTGGCRDGPGRRWDQQPGGVFDGNEPR